MRGQPMLLPGLEPKRKAFCKGTDFCPGPMLEGEKWGAKREEAAYEQQIF